MKASTKKSSQKTQLQLARDYRVDPRTILRWKELGAPLQDAQAMVGWIADQRHGTRHGANDESLPPGFEHANVLRMIAESAAANFCYEATGVLVSNLIRDLIEEDGMDPKKARGTGIMIWYGMIYQLKHWTMRDRYDAALGIKGDSLDKLQRSMVDGWKGSSRPPAKFPRQPIPESVRKAFADNGGKTLKYADISGDGGGLKMSDEE